MEIERFTELADRLMERVPPPLLEGLNGGVAIRRRAMRRSGDPAGVFILGEYVTDLLGCYIIIYWGSFAELFSGESDEFWEQELWETIRHELRHHVENRAGVTDLDWEDEADLDRFRSESPPEEPPSPRTFRLKRPIRRPTVDE